MAYELCSIAAAIDNGNSPLPPCIEKLIQNAPESFLDARAGQVAVTYRAMRKTGEPISFEAIAEKHLPLLTFISCELTSAAIPLEAAEFYAAKFWQDYQVRQTQSVFADAHEAIIKAPAQRQAIVEGVLSALDTITSDAKADGLPDLIDAADFIAEKIEPPDELVEGILHRGSKMVFGGGSKSFKTWCLLDLAISVATGTDWLGRRTAQGKVLFINFEIQPHAWQQRIIDVSQAKGVTVKPGQIVLWNLRGYAADFKTLIPKIIERCQSENFALNILDPIYKVYGNTDENSAGNVALLCNSLESLATKTGAAIAFGAHFAKGNAAGKEAIDRISGSGVFARDPDSLLIFTKHDSDDAFTVEPILRNFAPVEPFAVRWQFPLMQLADDLDPAKLKQAGAGRKKEYDYKKLLEPIADTTREKTISVSTWAHAAKVPRNTLSGYLPEMRSQKWIETIGEGNIARQCITNEGKAFINEK